MDSVAAGLPPPDPVALRDLAELAAMRAGRILLGLFGSVPEGLEAKSSATDMVSDADRRAEDVILDTIWRARPGDTILAEEGGARPGPMTWSDAPDVCWVVDPLDGTANWLHGLSAWTVSIAAEVDGEPVAGVVYAPLRDELFSAAVGSGAGPSSVPLAVRSLDTPGATELPLVATGFSYDAALRGKQGRIVAHILPRVRDIRRAGSAALDLAHVAAGRLDAFFEAPLARWDTAAGEVLVREAGGVAVPLTLPGLEGEGILATRPELLAELQALLAEAG